MADEENKKEKKSRIPKSPSFETVERPVESDVEENSEEGTLGLLMDVELELTAQLGACELPIKNVLDFAKGTIIELDTYTNKPIDLLANGKIIAKGEVVIIQDNFGLRITSVSGDKEIVAQAQEAQTEGEESVQEER